LSEYLPLLQKKKVAVITNASGLCGNKSIVDTLLSLGIKVVKIFGPEHGFRGEADAGEKVVNGRDVITKLPVVSLYGKNKKPTKEQLKDVDVMLFDIQDVGVRFYTYISTMCYAMEACAENKKHFIVCDRPNPNGFYIDGPVLKQEFKSFLGLHAVPLVYGMTIGEYAFMTNESLLIKGQKKCRLTVVTMTGYDRKASYELPVKPSPNLPNSKAVLLYPGLGLFEGTIMSLGRGTDFPFQVIGHPDYPDTTFCFTPLAGPVSKEPKYVNRKCYGTDLRNDVYLQQHPHEVNLNLVRECYFKMKRPDFFDRNFNFHSGNAELQEQLKAGESVTNIRARWRKEQTSFRAARKKYLLYPDFE
jgi:uncharacterized protein YbbC (DUF1343 family)